MNEDLEVLNIPQIEVHSPRKKLLDLPVISDLDVADAASDVRTLAGGESAYIHDCQHDHDENSKGHLDEPQIGKETTILANCPSEQATDYLT